jgi:hypothetical protein
LACLNSEQGVYSNSISVIKRLKDGTYFEDYFFKKLKEVIDFYGFDGVQMGDGVSSNRPALQKGDFSDDMVGQFVSWLHV